MLLSIILSLTFTVIPAHNAAVMSTSGYTSLSSKTVSTTTITKRQVSRRNRKHHRRVRRHHVHFVQVKKTVVPKPLQVFRQKPIAKEVAVLGRKPESVTNQISKIEIPNYAFGIQTSFIWFLVASASIGLFLSRSQYKKPISLFLTSSVSLIHVPAKPIQIPLAMAVASAAAPLFTQIDEENPLELDVTTFIFSTEEVEFNLTEILAPEVPIVAPLSKLMLLPVCTNDTGTNQRISDQSLYAELFGEAFEDSFRVAASSSVGLENIYRALTLRSGEENESLEDESQSLLYTHVLPQAA